MKKDCDNCFYSGRPSYEYPCSACTASYDNPPTNWELKSEPKTNGDRIRAMTDEELSEFLWGFDLQEMAREGFAFITRRKVIEWLQQPVED